MLSHIFRGWQNRFEPAPDHYRVFIGARLGVPGGKPRARRGGLSVVQGTYTHTYSDTSRIYFAEFESCCRLSELLNNRNGNYITRTKVAHRAILLAKRLTVGAVQVEFPAGRANESPVSSGLPIVEVLQGTTVISVRFRPLTGS